MKNALIAVFVLATAVNLISFYLLPERVATHFGSGGVADGWSSRGNSVLIFQAIYLLMLVMFLHFPRLVARIPSRWVSLPNSEYWLNPENRKTAIDRLGELMAEFGSAIFLYFIVIDVLTVRANLADDRRLDEPMFLLFLAAFLLYTVFWSVRLYRAFRLPESNRS